MIYENKGRYIVEFQDIPRARQHHIEIEVDERRLNYNEVELGFDEDRALKEAKRCLSCRRCLGCALCWAECKPEAIIFEMEDELIEVEAEEVILSSGVERAIERLDRKFGFGKHLNVITDIQLERMMSDTGPSGGVIIRPYDGEIPKSIAFVQGYGKASPQMQKLALTYGVNEAIIARKKLPGTAIEIFAGDLAAFQQAEAAALQGLDRIGLSEAAVSALEATEGQDLTLTIGNNGTGESKTFELVVLLTQPSVSKDLKALSKGLGLNVAYANFLSEGGAGLIGTDKEPCKLVAQP
jgi:heterodisulfide reductase subunit A-like polyferredoxin